MILSIHYKFKIKNFDYSLPNTKAKDQTQNYKQAKTNSHRSAEQIRTSWMSGEGSLASQERRRPSADNLQGGLIMMMVMKNYNAMLVKTTMQ